MRQGDAPATGRYRAGRRRRPTRRRPARRSPTRRGPRRARCGRGFRSRRARIPCCRVRVRRVHFHCMHVTRAHIPKSGAHLRIELEADPAVAERDAAISGLRADIASRQRAAAQANRARGNPGDGGQLEKSASAGTQLFHAAESP